jgi:hypothetical protein
VPEAAPMSIADEPGPTPPGSWYQRGPPDEPPITERTSRRSKPWFA